MIRVAIISTGDELTTGRTTDTNAGFIADKLLGLGVDVVAVLTVGDRPERLLQGPLADAMTHAGQLAMLRRLSGDPVRPENFILAEIDSGCLGKDQPAPVSPDEIWPEAPKAGHKV